MILNHTGTEMVDELPGMTLKTIGIVRNEVKQAPGPEYNWRNIVSEIVVDSSLAESLDGLDEFSHITVLYWMHQAITTGQLPAKIHPRGNPELPLVGRFATRSPHRPNPRGETTARLLQRQDNILKVEGLDAIDGTPVIDIKPYIPGYDSTANVKVPGWIAHQ